MRFALTSEAGLNDGAAFPFVYLAIAIALSQASGEPFIDPLASRRCHLENCRWRGHRMAGWKDHGLPDVSPAETYRAVRNERRVCRAGHHMSRLWLDRTGARLRLSRRIRLGR